MANRTYLLRYWLGDESHPSRRSGADFRCSCGKVEFNNYLGDYTRYRKDCPRCRGTGRYTRKLTRREHHVIKVSAEVEAKIAYRITGSPTFTDMIRSLITKGRQLGHTVSHMAQLREMYREVGLPTVWFDEFLSELGLTYDDLEEK